MELCTTDDNLKEYRQFLVEEQRFRLWGHSLALFHFGHDSLDYRVRDATIVKDRLAEILLGLEEHLIELVSIYRQERRPFEDEDTDCMNTSTEESSGSDNDNEPSDSDVAPIREVDFRLQSIIESLNALYSLATKIRHPRNRPQRTLTRLFRNVPTDDLVQYICERESAEALTVAYAQHEQLLRILDSKHGLDLHFITAKYASPTQWIIRRTAVANVRRKQQFIYWKEPALRVDQGQSQTESHSKGLQVDTKDEDPAQLGDTATDAQKQTPTSEKSLFTYATTLHPDVVGRARASSEISQMSRVSTALDLKGDTIEWPLPPDVPESQSFFTCPYCLTICPREYLLENSWRSHIINDLQAFHCTYQYFNDPNRLYGSKQEWIDHENQHVLVWHCREHDSEFETKLDYIKHLQDNHIETLEHRSPELIAANLGPSEKSNRPCPYCPIDPLKVQDMQRHIMFHLERLATLALPDLDDISIHSDRTNAWGRPAGSQHAQGKGRRDSAAEEFSNAEFATYSTAQSQNHDITLEDSESELTDKALQKLAYSRGATSISLWVQTLPSEFIESQNERSYPFHPHNLAPPTRRPRATNHGIINKILLEPTPEKQSHYNHIRDEEERNKKAPAAETQAHHNPAIEASSILLGRRPLGRRGGPLRDDKRFKTAIKRKLGYVCERCKVKKVSCDHYDFSKFEEAYQAQRNATRAESQRLSPAVPDLFGLEGGPAPTPKFPKVEDLMSDLNGYPTQTHNRSEHIDHLGNFVDTFNLSNVNFNNAITNTYASTFDQSYSPTSSRASSEITSSVDGPIPIGSEISPSTWKCEHKGLGLNIGSSFNVYMPENPCSWTGSKEELQQHFALQHSAFLDANYWCECTNCGSLFCGWDHPPQCNEGCRSKSWRRCLYATTPAVTIAHTQSVESERYSWNPRSPYL